MKFYFDGCSNTWGVECKDHEVNRYSKLVSDHFGAEEYNIAQRGGSDKRMMRNLLETDLEQYDYVIVQLTCKNRTEFWGEGKWKQLNIYKWGEKEKWMRQLNDNEKFFWLNYWKYVYSDKLGNINQLTYYHAMKNVLKDKKHLIIGISGWGQDIQAPVDINFNHIDYQTARGGHPNKEGHERIAEEIIKYIENQK
tara:strand:+ start:272 stop:856 length:585 start_codon:yes stop_codon:yes gene_type:complete